MELGRGVFLWDEDEDGCDGGDCVGGGSLAVVDSEEGLDAGVGEGMSRRNYSVVSGRLIAAWSRGPMLVSIAEENEEEYNKP